MAGNVAQNIGELAAWGRLCRTSSVSGGVWAAPRTAPTRGPEISGAFDHGVSQLPHS
ncbi:hypothetical protein BZL30_0310 [Mycobacterium kansasii]|uniref:Uncharacterized protein n=1 Tax=Mycobacterium kansasii TaxID=1768 RepID=A0A1V3XR97_MYCKA|nr:hypothetical protein BZL30_0310 [Mycobacterium kansasii]